MIYPLLGASKFGWHFVATELDKGSIENIATIIEKNKLSEQIEVRIPKATILLDIIKKDEHFDFCVCNPPFFPEGREREQRFWQ